MRPSPSHSLTRTTRSPSTRSLTIRSTRVDRRRVALEERRVERGLHDALPGEHRELPRVAERLVVRPRLRRARSDPRAEDARARRAPRSRTGLRARFTTRDCGSTTKVSLWPRPRRGHRGGAEPTRKEQTMKTTIGVITAAAVGAVLAVAPAASAKDGDVLRAGTCTGATHLQAEAEPRGRAESRSSSRSTRTATASAGPSSSRGTASPSRGPSASRAARAARSRLAS